MCEWKLVYVPIGKPNNPKEKKRKKDQNKKGNTQPKDPRLSRVSHSASITFNGYQKKKR